MKATKTTPPKNYSKGYGMRPGMGVKPVTDSNVSRHMGSLPKKSGKGKKC